MTSKRTITSKLAEELIEVCAQRDSAQDNANRALAFLANLINEREAKKGGYSMSARWLCLNEDLQQKYLAEAQMHIDEWWIDEQRAKQSRERNDIPFLKVRERD